MGVDVVAISQLAAGKNISDSLKAYATLPLFSAWLW
jgi:hypothetical protein